MIPFPEASILNLLQRRVQTSTAEMGTVCRMTPSDVHRHLVMLGSSRLVSGRQDKADGNSTRVYAVTGEGQRRASP